jgi:mycobactin peptide synthetase MbtE
MGDVISVTAASVSGSQGGYINGDLIHEIVAGHARRSPAAPALIHRGEDISYATLQGASDDYAVSLGSWGVGPGDVVPVSIPRSPRLVAILLAILKCGAAYAAFDPDWPRPRVEHLLRQIKPRIFVNSRLATDWSVPTWTVEDTALTEVASTGRRPQPVALAGDAPASVFFTSGTTGAPKGVLSPHRGVARLFGQCEFARLGTDAVIPQAAPLPWDAMSLELWGALLSGGTSVLVDEPHLLPRTLRGLTRAHGVNVVWLTSSLFNLFVAEDLGCFAGLRDLMIGGEKLSPSHVRKFLSAYPDIPLTNGYGPAESTVFTTTHRVTLADCADPAGIPLGTPVANTSIHVLNGQRRCDPRVVGELCVAGDGLAAGYLDDVDLTRRRFPTIVLDGEPLRVYRTGDLVHLSERGLLYFHGRADRQIKLRGHRIEPAEIEQATLGLDGVAQCAIVAEPDAEGTVERMAMFFVSDKPSVDSDAVRERLRGMLPDYLVPGEIHRAAEFPLTRNGKLDERALLALTARDAAPVVDTGHAEVSDDAKYAAVADAFADILGTPHVATDASFFELGGSSLAAARLCARLGLRWDLDISVPDIMENPTVKGLAEWLRTVGEGRSSPAAGAIGSSARTEVPLVAMQMGFLHTQMFDPDDLSGLCLLTWRIDGPVRPHALEAAFGDVIARHEALRCRFEIGASSVRAVVQKPGRMPFRHLRTESSHNDAWQRLRKFLATPLDPLEGDVCRGALVQDSDGAFILGVAIHHIVFDGWSEHLFAGDLSIAYQARVNGAEPEFARPAPGMGEVAATYHRRLTEPELERQRSFWRDALADLPDTRIDRPQQRGIGVGARTAALEFEMSADLVDAWRELANRFEATLFVAVLTGYAVALGRLTGQDRFGIGVPVARRETPVLASAVNCLINTVCIPVEGARTSDWHSMLRRVRLSVRSALAAQDLPFHDIVAMLGLRQGQRHPLYQVMFAYQDNEAPELVVADHTAQFVRPDPPQGISEILVEFCPGQDGRACVRVVYDREKVAGDFATRLREAYREVLCDGPAF